ncbi:MAG: XisI protein [Phycisphaerae bacterium]|nr:XisI protein [Phycisphaerae bacterium]
MDKLGMYRNIIKQLLTKYAELINRHPTSGIDTELVFDEDHDHYMLINVGWSQHERVRGNTIYVRLRNGKFWIEEDWTEDGIATDLLEAGVPKEDIVLAFHPPKMRPYTEFAVA